MKAISSIAVLLASLSPTLGSQLRAKWRVTYDTTLTCQSGMIAATVLQPSTASATSVVFRVTDSTQGSGGSPYYTISAKMQTNGRAKMSLPMLEAFAPSQHKMSNLVCSIQFGSNVVKVTCPTLPVCASSSPTMAPTHAPTKAPTQPPTSSPTLNPLYDVAMSPGYVNACQDGYLNVYVLHNGQPVANAALDLNVTGNFQYNVQGTTDANGRATLSFVLLPGDHFWKTFRGTLQVTNPLASSGVQLFAPDFGHLGCQHW